MIRNKDTEKRGTGTVRANPSQAAYNAYEAEPAASTKPAISQIEAISVKRCPEIFPDFLGLGLLDQYLAAIKESNETAISTQRFTPLLPHHLATRMINNSFNEITAENPLLSLNSFMALLRTQYSSSPSGPADSPARWALVNATIAIAIRFKTASASEAEINPIASMYYRNSTAVIYQLVSQDPSLLSMQALLAMSIFAKDSSDSQELIMLATNASRQRDISSHKWLLDGSVFDAEDAEQYEKVCKVVNKFKSKVALA